MALDVIYPMHGEGVQKMADRLDIEVALAKKAGMSYGMWKAMQPRPAVPIKPEPEVDDSFRRVCAHCGKEFFVNDRRVKKYCGDECQCAAWEKKRREKIREWQKKCVSGTAGSD